MKFEDISNAPKGVATDTDGKTFEVAKVDGFWTDISLAPHPDLRRAIPDSYTVVETT